MKVMMFQNQKLLRWHPWKGLHTLSPLSSSSSSSSSCAEAEKISRDPSNLQGLENQRCAESSSSSSSSAAAAEKISRDPSNLQGLENQRCAKLVFLGCPGVGKGTYAKMLSKHLCIPHIATGDLVREELSKSTPEAEKLRNLVKQGKLVSDDVVFDLLSKRLLEESENGEKGFILDGFPRTCGQAALLDELTDINLVLNLRLREDVLIMKCLGRRICSGCGNNYNLADIDVKGVEGSPRILMPALLPPPACQTKLTIREDDTEDVIRERLRIYAQECKPVEDYYRSQSKLLDFDVSGGIPETWPKLLAAMKLHADADDNKESL